MRTTLSKFLTSQLNYDPLLQRVQSLVCNLGVASRNVILAVCRDARAPDEIDLTDSIHSILADLSLRQQQDIPSFNDLSEILIHVANRPLYRSFLSMVLRNESFDLLSGCDEVIEKGFVKEFSASQNTRPEELKLSYQCLDNDNFHPAQYSIYYEPLPWWSGYARNLAGRFAVKLDRLGTLYPVVQRRKNMSRDTCRNLVEAGYESELDWTQLRTLDLELHCMKTGERVQGNCEMRMAWKFNELKPRFYYCTGGSSYWRSRYAKKVAVSFMESVDSTKLERRSNPCDIMYYLEEDDWLAIWDMYSFTTSLSELKHFLYYLAMNLKDDLRVQQRPLQVLDYHDGLVEITADRLLLEYNEGEMIDGPFSIWRVCEKLYGDAEEEEFRQHNAGMLGVHGDIGFSTGFHGFHLEAGSKKGTGCSAGDDALAGMSEDPNKRFLSHMRLIGDIAEEKATVFPPLDEHTPEQVTRFLKRRFTRTRDGFSMGVLFAFPSLAGVFGVSDQYHTLLTDEPKDKRIAKFLGQVGSFFWDCHAIGTAVDEEYTLIRRVLHQCYRRFGLHSNGSLPGLKHPDFEERMMLAVPPLDFDFFEEDWAEYLWDNAQERYALLPQFLGPLLIPRYLPGLEFITNEGGMLNALEDVGCVRKLRLQQEWIEVLVTNRRVFRSFLSGEKRSYRVVYTSSCPPWFDDIFKTVETCPFVDWNEAI